jgi:hypothetical protein
VTPPVHARTHAHTTKKNQTPPCDDEIFLLRRPMARPDPSRAILLRQVREKDVKQKKGNDAAGPAQSLSEKNESVGQQQQR